MKKIIHIGIVILGIYILLGTRAVQTVYGARGRGGGGGGANNSGDWQTARFRQAERAALRDGSYKDPLTFKTNYVAELFKQGKLIDTTSSQTAAGVALAKSQINAAVKANMNLAAMTEFCPALNCSTDAYANALIAKLQKNQGLTGAEIGVLYGRTFYASNTGNIGEFCGWGCISGFYRVTVNGVDLYYPLGQGPNPRAKEGESFTPGTLPGTIQARAVAMTVTPDTCDQIKAATTYRNGTQFTAFLGTTSKGTLTQSGSTYVSWSLAPNTYRVVPLSPGTSSIRVCLTDSTGSHFGQFTTALPASGTVTFDVAYGPPPAWYQAEGGDVYAGSSVTALTPSGASPRLFVLNGSTGALPGVVSYGGSPTDYDFSADGSGKGEAFVSSKNWLANDLYRSRDFYSYFYSKLGSPTTVTPDMPSPLTQPTYDATKSFYYLTGDVTTSGNWTVANGQKYIFLIDGSLTINGKINITGNGFVAFIVKNDISVAPAVGVAYNSVAPVVEGVYVSSGTIHTGASSVAGAEKFVGKGMFVGNDVRLERDLASVSQNGTYPAEQFIYNPGLLVSMPDILKNVPVSWQEVAP